MAEIYLNLYALPIIRSEAPSRLESDLEALQVTIGTSTLEEEIQHVTGIYLFEAAHELKSLSILLSQRQIAGSLEVVSKAVVERCGRVSWLLDHHSDVSPEQRAARIALEIGVSWQHYREVIQSLYSAGSDASKQATRRFRKIRSDIEESFEVAKEEVPNSTGDLVPSPDIQFWKSRRFLPGLHGARNMGMVWGGGAIQEGKGNVQDALRVQSSLNRGES